MFDVVIIGSGISGLVAAAALAGRGHRVLVLEQHTRPGGLTQTFERGPWTFATGVHYVSGAAPSAGAAGLLRRLLDALSDEPLAWRETANPYDVVRLPGFEFGIRHPEAAYRDDLLTRFPHCQGAIHDWFDQMRAARSSAMALMAARGLPEWVAWGIRLWKGAALTRFSETTVADALAGIPDPRLRAVLGARGGDYGARPSRAPLIEHALVTGAYNDGAWYPVGGPARLAASLCAAITARGGEIRTGADVRTLLAQGGRVAGVVVSDREGEHEVEAPAVISTMGLHNTVAALGDAVPASWQRQARALRAGTAAVTLYLGFEGDIAGAGAGAANVWLFEDPDIDRIWQAPGDEDAPALFVTFPSLKDPDGRAAPTGELIAPCETAAFDRWIEGDGRDDDYRALKARVEARLLAQFGRHFPALAPMIRFHEAGTPVTQRRYVRTPGGSLYGLEMSAERLGSPALRVRTPVDGLLLAGQDVMGAGLQASAISGLIAASTLDPRLFGLMRP